MRLRTCLAVELCAGAALVVGAGAGAVVGVRAATGYLADTEAEAATIAPTATTHAPVTPLRGAQLHVGATAPRLGTVFPAADEDLLEPLRTSPLVKVKLNGGGT